MSFLKNNAQPAKSDLFMKNGKEGSDDLRLREVLPC